MDNGPVPDLESPRMPSEVTGGGEPLVLIGGGLTGWASWEPHAARLAGTRRVVRLQLLNVQFGLENRALPDGYGVRMESRALAAALDALDLPPPLDLAAWSYGGAVALDFALDHPARVRTLTLIEPPALWVLPDFGRDDPDVQALGALFRGLAEEIGEADLAAFVRHARLAPPGKAPQDLPQWPVWMRHRRSLRHGTAVFDHSDDPARLRGFGRPVLLVTGTGTTPFLRRVHATLAHGFPQARTTEMPAGHAPHLVSMDRFLEELAAFHASVS